jgi:hypothetical protein
MTYLFIRVVKAYGLVAKDANGINDFISLFFCHLAFVHHLPCCSLVPSLYAYNINLPRASFRIP